jgi:hypothetical protein
MSAMIPERCGQAETASLQITEIRYAFFGGRQAEHAVMACAKAVMENPNTKAT